jgi:Rap1a immunity proteins
MEVRMYHKLVRILFIAFLLFPNVARAVTADDFLVKTTQNLINLCTVSSKDPQHREAIHMCHGYLIGAFHYHEAAVSALGSQRLVCLPEKGPVPTRDEAIAMFVEWAKARPQYMQEMPVETEFRFLVEKWPCKK